MLRVGVLGPLLLDAGTPTEIRSGRQRAVLAALAARADRPVPVADLLEELWGQDVPATAAQALQVHVSGLRKIAGDAIRFTTAGYVLAGADVDAVRFQSSVAAARAELA